MKSEILDVSKLARDPHAGDRIEEMALQDKSLPYGRSIVFPLNNVGLLLLQHPDDLLFRVR